MPSSSIGIHWNSDAACFNVSFAKCKCCVCPNADYSSQCTCGEFVKGNISRCSGCGQRNLRGVDGKPKQPPYDLCLQHKEYVIFENPHTGMHQLSSDLRNVYYHAFSRVCYPEIRYLQPHYTCESKWRSERQTVCSSPDSPLK